MCPIQWDNRPPSDSGPRIGIQVWTPPPKSRHYVRLLGPWRGVWLHWLNERTRPCLGETECQHCPDPDIRWMGYAPAQLWTFGPPDTKSGVPKPAWMPIVCPITEQVATVLRPLQLPGLVVEIERRGKSAFGEMTAMVQEEMTAKNPTPPPPFDVVPILLRMWKLRRLHFRRPPFDEGGDQPNLKPFPTPDQGGPDAPPAPPAAGGGHSG